MYNITVSDIVKATGGRLLCGPSDLPIRNISIDSRTMKGADLFVPIIGARVDAHRFIPGAFAAGAAATFTSEHEEREDGHPWIRVEDTVQALQALGAYCRDRMTIPVIGITGSVGKTSTREMVTAALSAGLRVTGTAGNSNGQLGVPITLSEADPGAEICVLEMGMSEPGEMARIAAVARVDMGIVTNIGVSHIENLGSQENICREKMHITDGFGPENTMILNGDDPFLAAYRGKTVYRTVFYGLGSENDYRAEDIRVENGRTRFTVTAGETRLELTLRVPGVHNVRNALAALAAAGEQGVSLPAAAQALETYQGFEKRLQMIERNGYTIIDDSYNASPESMRAALQVLSVTPTSGRRAAVLADMLELGPQGPQFHYQIGQYAASCQPDQVFTVGPLAREIARALREADIPVESFDENAQAAEALASWACPGDVVLFKGSHGMKLEEIVRTFAAEQK